MSDTDITQHARVHLNMVSNVMVIGPESSLMNRLKMPVQLQEINTPPLLQLVPCWSKAAIIISNVLIELLMPGTF